MGGSLIKRSPTRLKHKTKSFIVRSFIFLYFQRQCFFNCTAMKSKKAGWFHHLAPVVKKGYNLPYPP